VRSASWAATNAVSLSSEVTAAEFYAAESTTRPGGPLANRETHARGRVPIGSSRCALHPKRWRSGSTRELRKTPERIVERDGHCCTRTELVYGERKRCPATHLLEVHHLYSGPSSTCPTTSSSRSAANTTRAAARGKGKGRAVGRERARTPHPLSARNTPVFVAVEAFMRRSVRKNPRKPGAVPLALRSLRDDPTPSPGRGFHCLDRRHLCRSCNSRGGSKLSPGKESQAQTDWPHGLELCSPQLRCLACQKGASAYFGASAGILAAGPVETIIHLSL
jgi:hypothetical protein